MAAPLLARRAVGPGGCSEKESGQPKQRSAETREAPFRVTWRASAVDSGSHPLSTDQRETGRYGQSFPLHLLTLRGDCKPAA